VDGADDRLALSGGSLYSIHYSFLLKIYMRQQIFKEKAHTAPKESRPLVGSSRKSIEGLAANSTPIEYSC